MQNGLNELAAFVFPLPDALREQYEEWIASLKQTQSEKNSDQGCNPVFVPVYPACPGLVPYPAAGNWPTNKRTPAWPAGINPFSLFLIFLLLFIGFKKDQILAALRKLIMKQE
ncbi:MAG TPA: hypothetical protein PK728_06915 [Bacillota bacterium]|nr:hypothetical protein [Bacillota bacterium]